MIWIWVGFVGFVLAHAGPGLWASSIATRTSSRSSEALALVGASGSPWGWASPWWSTSATSTTGWAWALASTRWTGRSTTARTAAVKYVTGYVVEKSLSVDNIFVIAMVFGFFAVPAIYQHRVLFWGILGALVMRGVMIVVGADADRRVPLDPVRLRRVPDRHGGQDAGDEDRARRSRTRTSSCGWPGGCSRSPPRFHGEHFLVRAGTPASHEAEVPGAPEVAGSRSSTAPGRGR